VEDCWKTIFYGPFRSVFNHCNIIGLKISNLVEKRKIRAITVFKVITVGTNRKPLCNFLSVINSSGILFHTVSELSQFIVQILDTLRFRVTLWGLRENVRCSSCAHWKVRSGLPISVNWTFLLGVTTGSLRTKRDRKSTISLQCGLFDPKFQVQGVAPHQ